MTIELKCTCPETDPLKRAARYTVADFNHEPHGVGCPRWRMMKRPEERHEDWCHYDNDCCGCNCKDAYTEYAKRKQAEKQPEPKGNELAEIADLVLEDMRERKRIGMERYGVPLQPFNGRSALWDAYEEVLDLAVYLRQQIEEDRLAKTPA